MTAEVAILNKTAVALAADSAITISAGRDQHKIFDSADKLFELSMADPIAIMINSDMNFMEAPLPVLIKEYRKTAPRFARVRDAGEAFLDYLDGFARRSPQRIKLQALENTITPVLQNMNETAKQEWVARVLEEGEPKHSATTLRSTLAETLQFHIDALNSAVHSLQDAQFAGDGPLTLTDDEKQVFQQSVERELDSATEEQRAEVIALLELAVSKAGVGHSATGVIIAGFGSDELFPTLLSYEVSGVIGDRLKYVETNFIDIDRDGVGARVLPFAQREMVERFLYGLDTPLRQSIKRFCQDSISKIADGLLEQLDLPDPDFERLNDLAEDAERGFIDTLDSEGFAAIQAQSELEIESMVEFMPKAEMARMAEALVNLTSIKRRVSKGFETVGGPIDVAVISKAEGLVWVSRKHYFPQELNNRFFDRMRHRTEGRA